MAVTVKALNTDKIYAIKRTYDTLEYPLYQPGSARAVRIRAGGHAAHRLEALDRLHLTRCLDIKVNHQPGNILSYPEDVTQGGEPIHLRRRAVLDTFAQDEFELSDSSDYKYTLTQERMDGGQRFDAEGLERRRHARGRREDARDRRGQGWR